MKDEETISYLMSMVLQINNVQFDGSLNLKVVDEVLKVPIEKLQFDTQNRLEITPSFIPFTTEESGAEGTIVTYFCEQEDFIIRNFSFQFSTTGNITKVEVFVSIDRTHFFLVKDFVIPVINQVYCCNIPPCNMCKIAITVGASYDFSGKWLFTDKSIYSFGEISLV